MNRISVFIISPLSEQDIAEIVSLSNATIYVSKDLNLSAAFQNRETVEISISEKDKFKVNKTVLEQASSLPNQELNGESIITRFGADSHFHTWYFHRFRAYFDVCNDYYLIEAVRSHLNPDEETIIYTSNAIVRDFFSKTTSVKIKVPTLQSPKQKWDIKEIGAYIIYIIKAFFAGIFRWRSFKKKKHLIVTHSSEYSTTNPGKKQKQQHLFMGKILTDELLENHAILSVKRPPKLKAVKGFNKLDANVHKISPHELQVGFILIFFALFRFSNFRKVRRLSKKLKSRYPEIASIENPVQRALMMKVREYHSATILYYFYYLGYKKMFARCSFKSVTIIDENNSFQKAVLKAAQSFGIKSIGIQHGAIQKLHPSYIFGDADRAYSPTSDYFLIWGEHYRELLTSESIYSNDQLKMIGQLRMDYMFDEQTNKTLPEAFIKTNKHIVVFASQPISDETLRRQAAIDFIKACNDIENIIPVIKIHPRESKSYYTELVTSLNSQAMILGSEVDLYELLRESSILLTCFSTVGTEAINLNKPLIILDPLHQDIMGYIEENVAVKTTNEEEVRSSIKGILNETIQIDQESLEKFITKYSYRNDGKAYLRYFEFIEETFG